MWLVVKLFFVVLISMKTKMSQLSCNSEFSKLVQFGTFFHFQNASKCVSLDDGSR